MINQIKNNPYYPNLLVFLQFALIGLMVLFSNGVLSSAVGMGIFLLGAVLGLWAISHNQLGNFNIKPVIKDGSKLITTGIYKWVRHPMYSSVMLMMLGVLVASLSILELLLFLLLIGVLLLKAKREESLWLSHNEAYTAYKKSSKFFIPFVL